MGTTHDAASVVIRAEVAGEDLALEDGLCGLDPATLRALVVRTLRRVGLAQPLQVDVLVTDDETLRTLNRSYRGRDEVTDVLSFPLAEAPLVQAPADELWGSGEADVEGDLAVSRRDAELDTLVVSHGDVFDPDEPSGDEQSAERGAQPVAFRAPSELPQHLGDVVVAREVVTRQAQAAGHSPAWELAYLVAHGVLHLVGYDDHTDAGYAAMVAHQEAVLREIGLQP